MPHWRQERLEVGKTPLLIAPGQAFGTGDHATTALVAELLEDYLQPGHRVADLGCGSGILAIAALKLGAAQALAVDNDPLCAASVAEHRALNGINAQKLPFLAGDILQNAAVQGAIRAFTPDILLSNIVATVVAKLAAPAAAFLPQDARWISGGILREKERAVRQALSAAGWQIIEQRERQGWLAFCCKQGSPPNKSGGA
jgi:ribosomal protein L11 methyltransferase